MLSESKAWQNSYIERPRSSSGRYPIKLLILKHKEKSRIKLMEQSKQSVIELKALKPSLTKIHDC